MTSIDTSIEEIESEIRELRRSKAIKPSSITVLLLLTLGGGYGWHRFIQNETHKVAQKVIECNGSSYATSLRIIRYHQSRITDLTPKERERMDQLKQCLQTYREKETAYYAFVNPDLTQQAIAETGTTDPKQISKWLQTNNKELYWTILKGTRYQVDNCVRFSTPKQNDESFRRTYLQWQQAANTRYHLQRGDYGPLAIGHVEHLTGQTSKQVRLPQKKPSQRWP